MTDWYLGVVEYPNGMVRSSLFRSEADYEDWLCHEQMNEMEEERYPPKVVYAGIVHAHTDWVNDIRMHYKDD